MNTVMSILTFSCNYKCPYCDQARDYKQLTQHKDIDGEAWLNFFSEHPPALIHLSGGEPFLHRAFHEIVENLPTKHVYSLTSNLSQPLKQIAPDGEKRSVRPSNHMRRIRVFKLSEADR